MITDERELGDVAAARRADQDAAEPQPHTDAAETDLPDVRVQTERPPKQDHDWTRVPTAHETADSIARARRALAELRSREAEDQRRAGEEARSERLRDWHRDDRRAAARDDDRNQESAVGRG